MENISSDLTFLGIDVACEIDANQSDSDVALETVKLLHSSTTMVGEESKVEPLFIFVKSFSDSKNVYPWERFPNEKYIMPKYQIIQQDGKSSLVVSCMGLKDDDKESYFKKLYLLAKDFIDSSFDLSKNNKCENQLISEFNKPDMESYKDKFNMVMQHLRKGITNKLVLSRMKELTLHKPINIVSQIRLLRKRYSSCLNFIIDYPGNGAFLGSSPESLIKFKNNLIECDALAGTGSKNKLNVPIDSKKNKNEHAIVLEYLVKELSPLCVEISASKKPSIMSLKNVDHLISKVEGVVKDQTHILDLTNLIHPTPAVSGNPKENSVNAIEEIEDHCRGWYAGPIGWFNKRGWGEMNVALRSCLVKDRKAFLFSGSGIVEGSNVNNEWEETELKFLPILESLYIKNTNE